jgi:hypothetical protein
MSVITILLITMGFHDFMARRGGKFTIHDEEDEKREENKH